MRRNLITPFTNVDLDNTIGVDWITLVGVDDNAEQSRVSLRQENCESKMKKMKITHIDKFCNISRLQVPQYRSLIEISHV